MTTIALTLAMICLGWASLVSGAESNKYPAPRFPSYLRPPKSIDDVMPFARAAVRQTGGRTPLGLVEKGMSALIVSEVSADAMVMQAIKKAYEERGVKVYSAFLVAGGTVRQDGDHGESRSESRRAVQESLQYAGWKFCLGFGDRWMLT